MMGRSILFDMTIEDFANDADVVMLLDTIDAMGGDYASRMMTAPEVAQAHMRSTLAEMMQMMNGGHSVVNTGVFLDSAVEGLHFKTATQSGFTDAAGTFFHMDGETVQFHMGDVLIGEAPAEPFITPVDLIPGATDETHPTVINISRFLQTMDMDADPSNGIFIPDDKTKAFGMDLKSPPGCLKKSSVISDPAFFCLEFLISWLRPYLIRLSRSLKLSVESHESLL